mmetsp:Transcript_4665/g.8992  ORF Transcript_4665/g.8992 Transcript_4665/m.8992 type:complete len:134 (+) Transcript_4665:22-423(+)
MYTPSRSYRRHRIIFLEKKRKKHACEGYEIRSCHADDNDNGATTLSWLSWLHCQKNRNHTHRIITDGVRKNQMHTRDGIEEQRVFELAPKTDQIQNISCHRPSIPHSQHAPRRFHTTVNSANRSAEVSTTTPQ